jgi:hypothetical protein
MSALTSPKQSSSIGCCSTSRGILDWRSQARFPLSAAFFFPDAITQGQRRQKSQTHVRYDFFCALSLTRRMTSFTAPEGVCVFFFSLDAAAERDAVADGELADLDAVVGGERAVEGEHEVAVEADVLAHGRVVGEHDGAVPQRVVVADEAAGPHQLQEPLVVAEVVVLVGVHEGEVERPVLLLVRHEVVQDGERGALAEVDLVAHAGLVDAGQA